jgi:hypothetical protein
LSSSPVDVSYQLGAACEASSEVKMELVVVIVVLIVAGAMIPGNPEILFFR